MSTLTDALGVTTTTSGSRAADPRIGRAGSLPIYRLNLADMRSRPA